ncbi:zinc transporter 9 [Leptidea sinapis]|uniref:zinc transporter 9 n=1 Tax=Leptidea sinapis TaxID=189913 RepID=UPI0021C3F3C4|nr:zinc transporter 9 [Leptidea sinapis]
MMPFTVSALCRNFRRRFLFAKTLSNLRISLAITGCNLEQTIIENNYIIRPLHVTSCTQSKNETKETQVPNTKQNGETDAVKLSEKILKSKELRNIIVKTETDDNKLVTKVTIEKPKESSSSLDKSVTTEQAIAPPVKKRLLIDFSASYTERNFITPMRAMTEYLLKQSDLESLPKVLRRSPYESEPPITVYYRKDVDAKAIEVWGSKENLEKELLRREIDRRRYEQDVFTVKRRLRNYRREMGHKRLKHGVEEMGLKTVSGRVVLTAIGINGCNFLFKLCAWLYTGSHSMFSECIHSLADTVNQLILAYGIHKSVQIADPDHPYGYTNMRYVSSLISGVGIFCVGCGLSFYHGVTGILDPQPLHDYYWAYFVLGGAVVSEGATLMVALNAIKKGAKEANMSLYDYIMRSSDPSVNVVLFEDMAAVAGVVVAGSCMALSQYSGSPLPDAVGSLLVGSLLGGVASFIILSNVGALVGRSIRQEQLDEINSVLERDFMIRAIHDVKGIDIGSNLIRYKAEVDFDGRALTRSYLEKHDLNLLLEDMKKIHTIDDVEAFLLKHGENIVDMLGGEIDRIELKLRKKFPQIRHCDLEIL